MEASPSPLEPEEPIYGEDRKEEDTYRANRTLSLNLQL